MNESLGEPLKYVSKGVRPPNPLCGSFSAYKFDRLGRHPPIHGQLKGFLGEGLKKHI